VNFHRVRGRRIEKYGFAFANPAELKRYELLRLRELAGEIGNLCVHPEYPIHINEMFVCDVIPDFSYFDRRFNRIVVEDVKPGKWLKKTQKKKGVVIREWRERVPHIEPMFALKKKLLKAVHELDIEVIFE
jgi:hypothetical protein